MDSLWETITKLLWNIILYKCLYEQSENEYYDNQTIYYDNEWSWIWWSCKLELIFISVIVPDILQFLFSKKVGPESCIIVTMQKNNSACWIESLKSSWNWRDITTAICYMSFKL